MTTVRYSRRVCRSKVAGPRTTSRQARQVVAPCAVDHDTGRHRGHTLTRIRVLHRNASGKKYLRGVFNHRRRKHPNSSSSDDPSGPEIWVDPGVVWFRLGAAYSQRSGAVDDDSKKGVAITVVNLIWSQSVCCEAAT